MRRFFLVGLIVCCLAVPVSSQVCRVEKINRKGTAGADITVGSTAVTVADANSSRCALYIQNAGSDQMRCRDVTNDGAPTATAGILFDAGDEKTIEGSATGKWQCIQVTSGTSANVSESLP